MQRQSFVVSCVFSRCIRSRTSSVAWEADDHPPVPKFAASLRAQAPSQICSGLISTLAQQAKELGIDIKLDYTFHLPKKDEGDA